MTLVPEKTEAKELVVFEKSTDVLAYFGDDDGVNRLLAYIKLRAADQPHDMTTAKGRKEIISTGESVRKTRIFIEAAVKERADEIKKSIDAIKGRGAKVTEALNGLIAEIRKPVEEFNAIEEQRKLQLTNALNTIKSWANLPFNVTSDLVKSRLAELSLPDPVDWQEYAKDAERAKDAAKKALQEALPQIEARERLAEENAALQAKLAEAKANEIPFPPLAKEISGTEIKERQEQAAAYLSNVANRIPPQQPNAWQAQAKSQKQITDEIRAWLIDAAGCNEFMAEYLINSLIVGEFPHVQLKDK